MALFHGKFILFMKQIELSNIFNKTNVLDDISKIFINNYFITHIYV